MFIMALLISVQSNKNGVVFRLKLSAFFKINFTLNQFIPTAFVEYSREKEFNYFHL